VLLGGFAVLALVLASLGIYGVVSYSVNQRSQEIGIRMALGASASQVQLAVLRKTVALAMAGALVGTVGSVAVGLTKTIVFQRLNALSWETAGRGLMIGASVMAGSWVAKGFVLRLEADQFRLLMDGLLIFAGLVLLWGAFVLPHA